MHVSSLLFASLSCLFLMFLTCCKHKFLIRVLFVSRVYLLHTQLTFFVNVYMFLPYYMFALLEVGYVN